MILKVFLSGFPHWEIPGSKSICDSPRHIGAYPVLHRLLVPGHPPYALISLTRNIIYCISFILNISGDIFNSLIFNVQLAISYTYRPLKWSLRGYLWRLFWLKAPLLAFVFNLLIYNSQFTIFNPKGWIGGDEESRTPDPLLARQVLSQLSYTPIALTRNFKFLILNCECLGSIF